MDATTRAILDTFEAINRIPRCSKKEARILQWLTRWADAKGFGWKQDTAGNLVIKVPPTSGYETLPGVVFQAHVDMVCEKTPDSPHDFDSDPIRHVVAGDWLTADRTTLGADNGVAVAMGMVLAESEHSAHPPLELLFTVDEETGLNGAKRLDAGLFDGDLLLNVDSEQEGLFIVGCAGGKDTDIRLAFADDPVAEDWRAFRLSAGGMQGGHSGIDIGRQRANANVVLARLLAGLDGVGDWRLAEFKGGTVHNAIPRDAHARVVCDAGCAAGIGDRVAAFEKILHSEFGELEPTLSLSVQALPASEAGTTALSARDTGRVIDLLLALPHGVEDRPAGFEHLVQTSSNLAVAELSAGNLKIKTSQRSSVMSRLDALTRRIEAIAALAGASVETDPGYPAWPPDMNSALLKRCKAVYRRLFDRQPVVEVLHAGLECAIIGAARPGLDMISFGPTMENPHSPGERLFIPSVEKVWRFLTALLASFGTEPSTG